MNEIKSIIAKLTEQASLTYDRLPDIDLYMDQVIEYLSRQSISARENDKISSAMINNYIKDGLLPRANDKKYSREHLAYLMMISRLKQSLSVKDTGLLIKTDRGDCEISEYFNGFQKLLSDTAEEVSASLPDNDEGLSEAALRLAVYGYVIRVMCEVILAKLEEKKNEDEPDLSPDGQ